MQLTKELLESLQNERYYKIQLPSTEVMEIYKPRRGVDKLIAVNSQRLSVADLVYSDAGVRFVNTPFTGVRCESELFLYSELQFLGESQKV
ncbi:MAG: hypothetical protein MUF43_03680 [Flavobacterium sp.]|jgi:hypothetical protein|nr:hypothetical protein [Flavobacterium sp.]MCU0470242.1 hypothetical protein [Arcicella sp.]